MNSPYDNPEDILTYLSDDLAGLRRLLTERRAAFARGETLREWAFRRHYWLDSLGNVWASRDVVDTRGIVELRDIPGETRWRPCPLPPVDEIGCEWCGETWTLENLHERKLVGSRGDLERVGLHFACAELRAVEHARQMFDGIVANAGVTGVSLRAVPNRYGSQAYAGPWFTFVHPFAGRITIGWRSHVIQIKWGEGHDGRELFADHHATHDRRIVHAYSPEEASRCLAAITRA